MLPLSARVAQAQDTASVACAGQRIDSVVVHPSAPTAAFLRRVPILERAVSAIHVTTHAELIRRFMLLRVGDLCSELRRRESERILRAQTFIADATVKVLPSDSGRVVLEVEESDEVALVLDGAIGPGSPFLRFVRFGNGNLSGQGVYLAADWRYGGVYRDGYGARLVDNQLLGRPYTLSVQGHRTTLGDEWEVDLTHLFYTDIQRLAWRARAGAHNDYVQFANDINSSHALRLMRNYFDVGGILRLGPPGRLSLFGASISGDDERPGSLPVLITNLGFAPDTTTDLVNRYVSHRIARANIWWGVRDIGFTRVRGFDALTATQDFPVGVQAGTLFGRSLSVLGARDDDIFTSSDLYVGAVGRNNGLRVQIEGEARRENSAGRWDGILATAHAQQYFKLTPSMTTTASFEFSGGWRQRIPFNLTFSDPDGGVRGFSSSNTPGGRRMVGRLEHRMFVGRPWNNADLGVGAFVDAGRMWAGDIPYGVNTPTRKAVGVSLLAATPIRSPRMWRLDFVVPVNPEPFGHRFELRVSNADRTSFFLTEPGDILATRERTVPSSVFRWP